MPAYESRRLIWWLGVGVVLVTAIIVRLPILASADFFLSADEASNALAVKRLVEHGELRLYTWDSAYQGMVEGFISVPFALLLDFLLLPSLLMMADARSKNFGGIHDKPI